ncbi:unnamed protein product [Spirodela intermedia]|uniref:Uncharacterized protein n=1 Tax=Spirodela intermedia TaxID=51605 RepID=A0A7I8IX26_SPIIN|nr:unnamed protein product [Spirodela intermedia]CAA6662145.1 unnamed protein product [Spirodela intermedia]
MALGVCYGMLGDNLPPPAEVVALYKQNNIGRMRIFFPTKDVLQALRGSNIDLIMDVPREHLQGIASSAATASDWVQRNVLAYWPDVRLRYIGVGNELIPEKTEAQYVLPAMQNIYNALSSAGLANQIKVSTVVDMGILGQSYPLRTASSPPALSGHLARLRPLHLPGTVVTDGRFAYKNLFDAILDSVHAALEEIGAGGLKVVVSESGWPSAGGDTATIHNARTYNQNFIRHAPQGTPRRPGGPSRLTYSRCSTRTKASGHGAELRAVLPQ